MQYQAVDDSRRRVVRSAHGGVGSVSGGHPTRVTTLDAEPSVRTTAGSGGRTTPTRRPARVHDPTAQSDVQEP